MEYTLDKKLQCFKQIAQEKLQAILCSIPSPKDLIIEPALIKPLEHICVASWIKSKGVQKIFKFDQKIAVPKQQNTQVFLINANLLTFKFVLDQIHEHENNKITTITTTKIPSTGTGSTISTSSSSSLMNLSVTNMTGLSNYHVIIFPNVYNCFHTLLEEEGLYDIVTLHRFNWDFIYLDDGIMSLEMPQVFSELFMDKNLLIQSSLIHSFRILNMIIGKPDIILCFGENSEKILEMSERLTFNINNNNKQETKNYQQSDFSAMILIDRNKDYPSALLTPAIYSGLLLEMFKCRAGELEIQSTKKENKITNGKLQIFKTETTEKETKTHSTSSSTVSSSSSTLRMNSTYDEIYGENRFKHFSEASNQVRSQAKTLGLEVKNLNKMKINEMHEYISKKLPKITEMKNKIIKHLNLFEQIINDIGKIYQKQLSLEEDILNNINRKQIIQKINEMLIIDGHKYNILRLICLTYISIGLSNDELSNFIRNYCNVFGHKYLYVFQSLGKAGLLPLCEIDNNIVITSSSSSSSSSPLITRNKIVAKISNTTTKLPIMQGKFQQTEFQANANRLKLLTSFIDKPVLASSSSSSSSMSATGTGTTSVLTATISSNSLSSISGPGTTTDASCNPSSSSSTINVPILDDSSLKSLCPSYVFNGIYIPLVAQLASILLKAENIDDINLKLGSIDKMKLYLTDDYPSYTDAVKNIKQLQQIIKKGEIMDRFPIKRRTLIIFVIGGITYAEVAACDLISKMTNSKIIVTSNCICSGSDIISAAF